MPRLRSITQLVNPTTAPIKSWSVSGTSNASGARCFPLKRVTRQPLVRSVAAGRWTSFKSIMSDTPSNKEGVNLVTHEKIVPAQYPEVVFVTSTLNGSTALAPVYPEGYVGAGNTNLAKASCTHEFQGIFPCAYMSSLIDGKYGLTSAANPFQGGPTQPADRLGELPSRIVSQLEQIHSSTILIEARELPQLAQLFSKRRLLQGVIKSYGNGFFRRFVNHRYSPFRGSLDGKATYPYLGKFLRETQLGYTYGLAPTVREAISIYNLCRDGIKPRRQRFVVTIRDFKENAATAWATDYGSPGFRIDARDLRTRTSVWGARVTRTRPGMSPFDKLANGIDRLLGVNPTALIWEVMPLSFCVDWLLSVDDALDTIWLNRQTSIGVEYWSSEKTETKRLETYTVIKGVEGTYNTPVWLPVKTSLEHNWSYYSRTPRVQPTASDSIRTGGANLYNTFMATLIGLGFLNRRTR